MALSLIKKPFAKAISSRVLIGSGKRFIFIYHDISDPESAHYSDLYSTRVRNFKEQIEFLAKNFQLVDLETIVSSNRKSNGRGLACLTFDDGFLSVRETAFPCLSSKGIPFTVFLSQMAVNQNRLHNGSEALFQNGIADAKIYLDADDVKYLSAQGVGVGSHTSTHRDLAQCDPKGLAEEVSENKSYLEGLVGKKVVHLALPFGKREHYTRAVLEFCYSSGHDYVYTSNPIYFEAGKIGGNPRVVPRIGISNESIQELTFLINRPLFKRINI